MPKIYLSSPMTGLPDLNFPAFNAEATRLRGLGFDVVNPAELNPDGASWGDCMRKDIIALMSCDTVATLPGWENSKGAQLEVLIGGRLEMAVVKAQDFTHPPAILSVGRVPVLAEPVQGELKYHRQPLGIDESVRERLTLIAREAAISSAHRYLYMPAMPEDAIHWQPHAWVIEAMRMAELTTSVNPDERAVYGTGLHGGSVGSDCAAPVRAVMLHGSVAAFAVELIMGSREGGCFDAGDIQDMAVKHGLLKIEERNEACSPEGCACAEYGFPSSCYRHTDAMNAALDAVAQLNTQQ